MHGLLHDREDRARDSRQCLVESAVLAIVCMPYAMSSLQYPVVGYNRRVPKR